MAHFIEHQPCEKCGSKDNKALYSDGSTWCFGCGVSSKPKHIDVEYVEKKFWYPKDLTKELNPRNKAWLQGYDLSLSELDLFSYSPSLDRHVYTVYNDQGEIIMWEGRSMTAKPKTLCVGPKPVHILNPGKTNLVVCEDIISALKISRHTSCMPLFGSKLRHDHLAALSKEYRTIKVWLDSDKFDEAMNITVMAANLGMKADVIFTHRDPKLYNDDLISRKVK